MAKHGIDGYALSIRSKFKECLLFSSNISVDAGKNTSDGND
jgi:hypothetical protein